MRQRAIEKRKPPMEEKGNPQREQMPRQPEPAEESTPKAPEPLHGERSDKESIGRPVQLARERE